MKTIQATILLVFFTLATFAQKKDSRLRGLDKELNEILRVTYAAGFSVAIVEKDKIVYSKGFGYRDIENKTPVNENTLFAIGSTTKAFTSGILGRLREKEKISFEDNPRDYIPNLTFFNDNLNTNVIIRDLMSHRTGLPRHDRSWQLFPTYDRNNLLKRIEYQEPATGLRQRFYYNNFMFLVQGIIAEKLTGKSWENNIKEHFFEPLEMIHSNTSISELEKSDNAAKGYTTQEDHSNTNTAYYKIAGMAPAGGINSSAKEMANWLITWINNGVYKGKKVLPQAYVRDAIGSQMTVGTAPLDHNNPDMHFHNYGYGWFLSSYKGHYRVEHGGGIQGFAANVAFYPTDSLGIVVLTNQYYSRVPELVRDIIADRMLKVHKTDWTKRFVDAQNRARNRTPEQNTATIKKNTKISHAKTAYTGAYKHPGYGKFSIELKNDSLIANFESMKVWLKQRHYDVFEPYEITANGSRFNTRIGLLNFSTNNAGEISGVDIRLESRLPHPITFERSANISKEKLKKYVGEYVLNQQTIKIYIKNEDVLYFLYPGQSAYELSAVTPFRFNIKGINGYSVEFHENEDGSIDAISVIQPRGTFEAKRK